MLEAVPSRTAMRVAIRRAAHQVFDAPPLVLDDPCAVPIIGVKAEAKMRVEGRGGRVMHVGRAFMVGRSRFAEDALARAVQRGVRQYVVLGAGLDTFAYRNPHPGLRVFEVDHPATQAWKRHKLSEANIAIPASLTYVPVNFEHQSLAEELQRAGLDPGAPVFFSWLGVVMYLTSEAINTTLRYIGSLPAGGGLALDYVLPASELNWFERILRGMLARKVKQVGEPFISFFRPGELHARLEEAGFQRIEDLAPAQLDERYFRDRRDHLHPRGSSLHVVSAEV